MENVSGQSAAFKIEASEPLGPVDVGSGIERLLFRVERGGREIGCIELPGGAVAADVIAAEVQALIARTAGAQRGIPAPAASGAGQPSTAPPRAPTAVPHHRFDRDYFERIFASNDPWNLTSDYERMKATRNAVAVARGAPRAGAGGGVRGRALYTRASPGTWTTCSRSNLGARLALARERCAGSAHVRFEHFDVRQQALAGRFELIVVGELLHYLADGAELAASSAVCSTGSSLRPPASLPRLVDLREPTRTCFDWGCAFGVSNIAKRWRRPRARHVRGIRTPLYRVDLFRKRAPGEEPSSVSARSASLPWPRRYRRRWRCRGLGPGGARCQRGLATHVDERDPILAYHRIAADAEPPSRSGACVRAARGAAAYLEGGLPGDHPRRATAGSRIASAAAGGSLL